MLCKFKTDNYKTFEIFGDNILEPRAYFIPFASEDEMRKTDIRTERYSSSRVSVLGGKWKFAYFDRVSQMPDFIDTEKFAFDEVEVPSMWQFTGYEKPYYLNTRYQFEPKPPFFPEDCPVSVYIKEIDISDSEKTHILTFLGVAGSLDVFVNGRYAGYSEGSHNTAEFDITPFLTCGKNEIAAVVHKWCNGTYLECQDMFRNNGIFRDVLLTEYGNSRIYDISAETFVNPDGTYRLEAGLKVIAPEHCGVCVRLEKDGTPLQSKKTDAENNTGITFDNLSVKEWSAETPYLYDLIVSLEKDGGIVEIIRRKIGFRHIEIKGDVYYFNGRKIKLLGVNHHDTDAEKGYCMTVSDMERDISVFKKYNINAVRTSHYPPDPVFLDLCDEYGIYVIDEADIECHGMANIIGHRGDCSDNPAWKKHYWDRVYRMFSRDKNHPCISMWSLGNESHGISNHDYCYNELKKLSPLPVHYEAACRTRRWAYDVISEMYQHPNIVDKIANGKGALPRYYGKPYFLCEYAHAMGVGAGDAERYVSAFLRADNLLGGCVWEFADHAVYHKDGRYRYTYGGDHNEEFHDGCFCVDGLFFPDRTPHSGALQIKNCYRPVRAKFIGKSNVKFKCINFFAPENLTVRWEATCVNHTECGEFSLSLLPQEEKTVEFKLKEPYDALVLRYYRDGEETASEQLEKAVTLKEVCIDKSKKPEMKKSENRFVFIFDGGEIIYDGAIGQIISYKLGEKEILNRAPLSQKGINISLFRAPLDNDRNYREWKKYMLDTEHMHLISSKPPRETENAYVISNRYALSTVSIKKLLTACITYKIYGDGSIEVSVLCEKSRRIMHCPRFGVCLELQKEFDRVSYYGLGDRQSLADFREHAMLGKYECRTSDLCEKYIKPQESSMRYDTRCFTLTDGDGTGLEFIAVKKPFIFGADRFTSYQCAKAMHQEDLGVFDTNVIHIDSYMLGAGSNSCGPVPDAKYVKNKLGGERLDFVIRPVTE